MSRFMERKDTDRGVGARTSPESSSPLDRTEYVGSEPAMDLAPVLESSPITDGVDIEEAARVRLQHSPYRALRRVACEFIDGTLTLRGSGPTFHYKQLALVSVLVMAGVG